MTDDERTVTRDHACGFICDEHEDWKAARLPALLEQDEAVWRLIDALVTPMIVGTQSEVAAGLAALRRVRAALASDKPGEPLDVERWHVDGSMIYGWDTDESFFIGDALSHDDALRLADAHNGTAMTTPTRQSGLREAAQDALRVLGTLDHQAADGGGARGQVYVTIETWQLVIQPVIENLRAALAAQASELGLDEVEAIRSMKVETRTPVDAAFNAGLESAATWLAARLASAAREQET